ncbi:MAG: radical SAM protein [Desulfovibrio sp.]|jgi:uncharacterized protein|nr:radical SAM protein [Desulfovibrio sp.]
MELYAIPYKDKVIIYRPLRHLAFIGNRAMARLCETLSAAGPAARRADTETDLFLRTVGFFEEDARLADNTPVSNAFLPTVCVLFLTDACNLRCIYCYAHGDGAGETRDLPLSLARAAIDTVCRNALDQGHDHYSICFHGGGEPTMAWSVLKDCVTYARKSPIPAKINLTSNGVWTETQRAWILDNIDEISLSFDGLPSIQDTQRPRRSGRGSHASVARTLRALDRKEIAYGIRVTVTDRTITRIPENIDYLCRETGSPAFQVEPAFAHGRARLDRVVLRQQADFAEYFMEGYDIATRHQRHMYYSGARPWLLTSRFCDAVVSALIVGPDGFLTACYEICNRRHELAAAFIFGDMDASGAIRLTPGARQGFLVKIEEHRQSCKSCFCFYHCAGDCPSKTFSGQRDNPFTHGSRCELNRTITMELLVRYIEEGGGVWRGTRSPPFSGETA